jgi:hypothetical protein
LFGLMGEKAEHVKRSHGEVCQNTTSGQTT